jgi:hypothetical protein
MTRKLRLEDLRVESFTIDDADAGLGTVRAHEFFGPTHARSCGGPTCQTLVCACVVTEALSDCVCPTP